VGPVADHSAPLPLTEAQLLVCLDVLTRSQVQAYQERRLKDAVKARRNARVIGREIVRRAEQGEWHGTK
jgi:hypothetical protein